MTETKKSKTQDDLIDEYGLTKNNKCVQVSNGVFVLKPVESEFEGPARQIPDKIVVTVAKQDRLLKLYYKTMDLLAVVPDISGGNTKRDVLKDISWAMNEEEVKSLNKSLVCVEGCKLEFLAFGIDEEALKIPETYKLPPVIEYRQALKNYTDLKGEIDARVMDRAKNSNNMSVLTRFIFQAFSIATEDRDEKGNSVSSYDVDEMLNSSYWKDQMDLITDVYTSCIEFVLSELHIKLKKTQKTMLRGQQLSKLMMTELESDLKTEINELTTPMKSSQLSLGTTLSELDLLASTTPNEKSGTSLT